MSLINFMLRNISETVTNIYIFLLLWKRNIWCSKEIYLKNFYVLLAQNISQYLKINKFLIE